MTTNDERTSAAPKAKKATISKAPTRPGKRVELSEEDLKEVTGGFTLIELTNNPNANPKT